MQGGFSRRACGGDQAAGEVQESAGFGRIREDEVGIASATHSSHTSVRPFAPLRSVPGSAFDRTLNQLERLSGCGDKRVGADQRQSLGFVTGETYFGSMTPSPLFCAK